MALCFVLGICTGRASLLGRNSGEKLDAGTPPPPSAATASPTSEAPPPLASNAGEEIRETELLDALPEAWRDDPRVGIARSLAELGGGPLEILDVVVNSMSDDEIASVLSSMTALGSEKLRRVRDPRAYAHRMAELGLAGLLSESEFDDPQLPDVHFSERRDFEIAEEENRRQFLPEGKIFANFEMGEYDGDEVLVKWTRVDDPKIMLFRHYEIRPDAEHNHVWLKPDAGWNPGRYRVAFYSADEVMRPLAVGHYQIASETTPSHQPR